jgi:hypothetical protein
MRQYEALDRLKDKKIESILLFGAIYDPSENVFTRVDKILFCLENEVYVAVEFEQCWFDCDEDQDFNGEKWILKVEEHFGIVPKIDNVQLRCPDELLLDEIFLAVQDVNSLDERFYETCDHLYLVFNQFEMLINYDCDKDKMWVGHIIVPMQRACEERSGAVFLEEYWKR